MQTRTKRIAKKELVEIGEAIAADVIAPPAIRKGLVKEGTLNARDGKMSRDQIEDFLNRIISPAPRWEVFDFGHCECTRYTFELFMSKLCYLPNFKRLEMQGMIGVCPKRDEVGPRCYVLQAAGHLPKNFSIAFNFVD
jgi:hypothetical protein